MDSVGALVPFVLIIGAFYVLIIRPSRNRAKTQQRLLDRLEVGARVMTTSGLYAEVAAIDDDGVLLEVAPGVTMRWTKAAVSRILPEPEAADNDVAENGAAENDADGNDVGAIDIHDEDAPESPASSSESESDDPEIEPVDAASDADSAERTT